MLRLLVPFQVSSKANIYNLVPSNNPVLSPMTPAFNTPAPVLDIPPITPTINSTANNISPITVVWIAGILLILLYTSFVYVRAMQNMKTSLPCENMFVENWLQSIPLKRKIQVRVFDRIKTPLTYGLIHPVILLPKNIDFSNEEELLAILTHEYIHIKRFDNIKKLLMVLTLSIHWFNPLVWVMFVLYNRDIELACDEKISIKEIIGEKGWNSTEGWYTWTRERVDKQIENNEDNLEDIKNGIMHSKTVDGTREIAMVYDPKDAKASDNNFSFLWPTVETEVMSSFNEYPGHSGIDIKGAVGTPVYASAGGTVRIATEGYAGYGNYIMVDHGGGYVTLYAHCNELRVAVGENIVAGQIIATIGSTGNTTDNCMHFEI